MKIYRLEISFNDKSVKYDREEGYDYGTLFDQYFSNMDSALKALTEVFEQFKIAAEKAAADDTTSSNDYAKRYYAIDNFEKRDDSISWHCGRYSYFAMVEEINLEDKLDVDGLYWNLY